MKKTNITLDLENFNKSVSVFQHTDENGKIFSAISYKDAIDYLMELHKRIVYATDLGDDMELD